MVLQSSGQISFANIQTEFGGANPIEINEYYTNNASGYTNNISGLPTTGNSISLQQFYGKTKSSLSTRTLGNIYDALQPYRAEYKNANFYEYTRDQGIDYPGTYIDDGGGDMFDAGNYTQIVADDVASGGTGYATGANSLSYNTTTESSIVVNGKTTKYISLGNTTPLIMLGKSSTRATWGFQKKGNNGADGRGINTIFNVYANNTVNGFTVYAFCRQVYNSVDAYNSSLYDPSIGDLYFAIGDSSSTFYSQSMTVNYASDTNDGYSSMRIDCAGVLFGCILCSKPNGAYISAAECQTVLTSLTNRLKP